MVPASRVGIDPLNLLLYTLKDSMFTKAPTAPMLRLLKTLMDGAARIPLLARLYQ